MPKKYILKYLQIFDYYENLIKLKKLGTKNIVIDEKHYKDLVIYFTRYDRGKSLYCHEQMGKIKKREGKKYLMADDYVLIKVLDRINKITDIDNAKILIDTDYILSDDITLKNAVILMNLLLKMIVDFIHNCFWRKHCMMNKYDNNMQ